MKCRRFLVRRQKPPNHLGSLGWSLGWSFSEAGDVLIRTLDTGNQNDATAGQGPEDLTPTATKGLVAFGKRPPRGSVRLVANFSICHLFRAGNPLPSRPAAEWLTAGRRKLIAELSMKEEPQKDDDWNRNAHHPKE